MYQGYSLFYRKPPPKFEIEALFGLRTIVINSERSEECIDFTMIRNNAPISNYGGGFRCKIFKNIEKNKKQMTEKREILRKTSFRPNRFFFYGCNSKTNNCKYLKLSPNIYISVIYIQLNFHKILTFFDVDKKILNDQKVLRI
ncbi:Uncharacterized protein FWK35_00008692 [Aphis craccivora]|uniref:Uncharacterized protein n=1 Tax=Aphis craccivora TaxID=307492 RepID=A0A6G0YZ57_APHCR|nr:Uncharacterized protein FWK35_00008692 [Aphis craccivora]